MRPSLVRRSCEAIFQLDQQRLGKQVLDSVGGAVDMVGRRAGEFHHVDFPHAVSLGGLGGAAEAERRELDGFAAAVEEAVALALIQQPAQHPRARVAVLAKPLERHSRDLR
jgi:hypothetical protein